MKCDGCQESGACWNDLRANRATCARVEAGDPYWIARTRERSATLGEPPVRMPQAEPDLPSLAKQAGNLAKAVAGHLAAGMPKAPPEVVAARWATCRACPQFRPSDRRCGGMTGCGCYLKAKIVMAEQACPLGKWPT